MRTYLRPRYLFGVLGVTIVAGSILGARLLHSPSRADDAAGNLPAPPSRSGMGVVCFGYVDMEHGITSLDPLVPGRVMGVEVREGEEVKAGQVLVRLDDYQARRRVQEAEADLVSAQELLIQALKLPKQHQARLSQQRAAIKAVQHRLESARLLLARKRELVQKQLLNATEADAAEALVQELQSLERAEKAKLSELELNDPTAGIKSAQANVSAKQARLDQARRGVEECALKAPSQGTVLRIMVNPGDVLGAQPKEPAILFCPKGRRIIRAEVEQEFASRVAVGQTALIRDDATGGALWHGRVLRLSDWYTQRRSIMQEPNQAHDVRTLECLIALDNGPAPLRIGQRVRVTLKPKQ
jgi:multidrug resistance efflux pump